MSDWVTVRTASNKAQAAIIRGLLRDSGIECVLGIDDAGGQHPELDLSSGVAVQVHEDDLARAEQILEERENSAG